MLVTWLCSKTLQGLEVKGKRKGHRWGSKRPGNRG